jgi:hypothetical protein
MVSYVDCWQDSILSQPTWLKPHLEEACRVMVVRESTASKCRGKNVKRQKNSYFQGTLRRPHPLCATVLPPSQKTLIDLMHQTELISPPGQTANSFF